MAQQEDPTPLTDFFNSPVWQESLSKQYEAVGASLAAASASQVAGESYRAILKSLDKSLAQDNAEIRRIFKSVPYTTPTIELPVDFARISSSLSAALGAVRMDTIPLQSLGKFRVSAQLNNTLARLDRSMTVDFGQQRFSQTINAQVATKYIQGIFKNLGRRLVSFLPPNLHGLEEVSLSSILEIVDSDGIPLYLVPRSSVAERLLAAPDTASRTQILEDSANLILHDCEGVLGSLESRSESAHFLLEAAEGLRQGMFAASQALSTNILDTLIGQFPDSRFKNTLKANKDGYSDEEILTTLSMERYLAVIPVRKAHDKWHGAQGAEPPLAYSRHGSVHGVSKRQYSKRNAVHALMLATSLTGYVCGDARSEV